MSTFFDLWSVRRGTFLRSGADCEAERVWKRWFGWPSQYVRMFGQKVNRKICDSEALLRIFQVAGSCLCWLLKTDYNGSFGGPVWSLRLPPGVNQAKMD